MVGRALIAASRAAAARSATVLPCLRRLRRHDRAAPPPSRRRGRSPRGRDPATAGSASTRRRPTPGGATASELSGRLSKLPFSRVAKLPREETARPPCRSDPAGEFLGPQAGCERHGRRDVRAPPARRRGRWGRRRRHSTVRSSRRRGQTSRDRLRAALLSLSRRSSVMAGVARRRRLAPITCACAQAQASRAAAAGRAGCARDPDGAARLGPTRVSSRRDDERDPRHQPPARPGRRREQPRQLRPVELHVHQVVDLGVGGVGLRQGADHLAGVDFGDVCRGRTRGRSSPASGRAAVVGDGHAHLHRGACGCAPVEAASSRAAAIPDGAYGRKTYWSRRSPSRRDRPRRSGR